MSKYQRFIFKDYKLALASKKLSLVYSFDDEIDFTEEYLFDFEFADNLNGEFADRLAQLLFFIAGVSYFKAYIPGKIEVRKGTITPNIAAFLSKTYERGLGEFFYVNSLDPLTPIIFPVNEKEELKPLLNSGAGYLVGLGGGKDSLLSVEILRSQNDVATWMASGKEVFKDLVSEIGLPFYRVERKIDHKIIELKESDAYSGHIPISAILACLGILLASLVGKRDVVVSNENSANEPTLTYKGVDINHQYSKSIEFEQDFQKILKQEAGDSLRYYSLLRPFSELRIAELFAKHAFSKYKHSFSSCNVAQRAAYTSESPWCGACPKCAFVFLILSPFVEHGDLEDVFAGKNLLLDPEMETTYRQLLGIEGDKPLECIGEIKESRAAMQMAKSKYPELSKYDFDLPIDYDYKSLAVHSMPSEIFEMFKSKLA